MTAARVPVIVVLVPVEGAASARIECATYEEELRAGLEVFDRNTILEVAVALGQLRQALLDREGAA
jgi:hypothetical protein